VEVLRKVYRTAVIIGDALTASLVVYLVIVTLIDAGILRIGGTMTTGRTVEVLRLLLLVSPFFFSIHCPRLSRWEEWYRQQGGGRGGSR